MNELKLTVSRCPSTEESLGESHSYESYRQEGYRQEGFLYVVIVGWILAF